MMFRVIQELYNTDSEVLSYRKKYLIIQFKPFRLQIRNQMSKSILHIRVDIPITIAELSPIDNTCWNGEKPMSLVSYKDRIAILDFWKLHWHEYRGMTCLKRCTNLVHAVLALYSIAFGYALVGLQIFKFYLL